MSDWTKLIQRYAYGKRICNCGDAYLWPCGHGVDASGNKRTDLPTCRNGCGSNMIWAKEYVARLVLEELKELGAKE